MDSALSQVLKSPTIALKVGSPDTQEEVYHVHESVLIRSSHYFKQLLNSKFAENSNKEVVLSTPVDTPEACELFLEFAYNGKCEPQTTPNALLCYGKAYLFGEKIQATEFKAYIYEQAKTEAEQKFKELDFSFKCLKPADTLSEPRVELLETWGLLIEMIYQGTYDNKDELLSAEAPSDATVTLKGHMENMKSWLDITKLDLFRGLLSQICAQYPLVIACSPHILRLARCIPEFAADILNQQLKLTLEEVEKAQVLAVQHLSAMARKKALYRRVEGWDEI
ncbi:hypothetical protein TWF730_007511 [Orbilia blumenaviensis]|uniref:BTB domain-containing protein n=1 Tax=Orbilia blumenaviensis TaxID=1796055 RepID=A0AAV9VAX2_9PEZI